MAAGHVKLKHPRGESPVKPKNTHAEGVSIKPPHKKSTTPEAMLFFYNIYNICLIMRYTRAPTAAVQGMVIIQADTIW